MIDMHTHILPGIDDGVDSEDEAVDFARMAYEDGTRAIVATPHCKEGFFVNQRPAVLDGVEALRARLAKEGLELELHPGAEVHLCTDLVARVRDGRAPTIADNGRTLLLELSLRNYPVELENLIFELRLAGIEVLLAHPERIRYFQDDPARYEELVRLGAWGQINSGSITGQFGQKTQDYALRLLAEGLVHVVASDAHNCRGRHPRMSEALEQVEAICGAVRCRAMVDEAPRALIEGRAPELPPLERSAPPTRSFFGRLFGRGE